MSSGRSRHILKLLGLMSVFTAITPFLVERFTLFQHVDRVELMAWTHYGYGLTVTCLILLSLLTVHEVDWPKVENKGLILGALSLMAASLAFNGAYPRLMSVFAAICIFWIWGRRPKIWPSIDPVSIVWPVIVVVALPMLLELTIGPIKGFYANDSFRGVFESRTDLAMLSGLAILAIMLSRKYMLLYLLPFCVTSLAFTASRAGMLAASLALLYVTIHYWQQENKGRSILALASTVWIWVSPALIYELGHWNHNKRVRLISMMPDMISGDLLDGNIEKIGLLNNSGNRLEIFLQALRQVWKAPFFGGGGYFQQVNLNGTMIEAHNSILQSLLNFGSLATVAWFALLYAFVKNVNWMGRSFLLLWFVFGLFQPGFDAFLFLPVTLTVFVLAIGLAQDIRAANI